MGSQRSGHAQGIIDQTEIEIAEDNKETRSDVAVIGRAGKDQAERQFSLVAAAKYLDGQEYDLNRITAQVQVHIEHITQGFVALGRLLLAVKAVEGHGKFANWLEGNFQFSHRTANYFMYVAHALEQRPELAPFTNGGVKKAVALLDLPEDYQTEFIEKGSIDGEPLDKLLTMSHRELRAEVNKFKNNFDKAVEEEVKGLKKERGMLIAENARLKKFEPDSEKNQDWCLEQMNEIKDAALGFSTLCRRFMIDERLKDDIPMQAKVEQHIQTAKMSLRDLNRLWTETFDNCEE